MDATISEEDLQMLRPIQAYPDITYTELSGPVGFASGNGCQTHQNPCGKRVISRVGARKTGVWKINIPP